MPRAFLTLSLLEEQFAICRLECNVPAPAWAFEGSFFSITRTSEELSIVCPVKHVPENVRSQPGWRLLRLDGPMDLELTGIVASIAEPLADAGVAIFPMTTYDREYILIKEEQVHLAITALTAYGHAV